MAINKDKSTQVWIVLSKEEYAELKKLSEDQERSISKQAAYIIKEYLKHIKSEK